MGKGTCMPLINLHRLAVIKIRQQKAAMLRLAHQRATYPPMQNSLR